MKEPQARLGALSAAQVHNCWSEIGVWSPTASSCERLAEVVHCHNCPVYTSAGRALLESAVPDQHLDAHTEMVAAAPVGTTAEKPESIIVFRLGVEWFAIATRSCGLISQMGHVHRLPHKVGTVLVGLVNVRGRLLLCASLAKVLGIEQDLQLGVPDQGKRLMVIGDASEPYVVPVDEILGVDRLKPGSLRDPPQTLGPTALACTRGVVHMDSRVVALLDIDPLIARLNEEVAR